VFGTARPGRTVGQGWNRPDCSSRSYPRRARRFGPGRREYVVEAVGSAVTDRASLLGGKVERLCGVNCHCEPRFHGSALYSGRYVLTGAESHVGLTHARGPSTCIRRIGIRSVFGAARPGSGLLGEGLSGGISGAILGLGSVTDDSVPGVGELR
jgi:hypothetical protein